MSGTGVHLTTHSPEETQALAAAFAELCQPNDVIGLQGTLGAGKTCFVKGLAAGLNVKDLEKVVSPTFVLLRRYSGRLTLYHFDAYRLQGAAEMEQIGCAETFEGGGVSVIEWADHVAACLPGEHFMLVIMVTGERDRDFLLTATGAGPAARLGELPRALSAWRR
jgi:tRNA threonylcarbamoyladenosine biosynthesis protein TsaE